MSMQQWIASGGGSLLLLLTLIQIAPIKVNPWSWLAKSLGNAMNGDLTKKVDKLSDDVKKLRTECDEREATSCRTRILHFGDECLHGTHHSKEHFNQILRDITNYEHYCDNHPDFENDVAVETVGIIKKVYRTCMEENSFLK